jgi:Zn-dependent protease
LIQRISDALPETPKKWLSDLISSKSKDDIAQRVGSPYLLTKPEALAYVVALSALTFAFSYVQAEDLGQILSFVPLVLVTSIIVEFSRNFSVEVIARRKGVWTEHRLWYLGLSTFLFSTLLFRTPFSCPSRNVHHSRKINTSLLGLVSVASIILTLVLAAVFFSLFITGFTFIGNTGLVMCLTMAFFDTIPISPMSGKDIYDWNKTLWAGGFAATLIAYMLLLIIF